MLVREFRILFHQMPAVGQEKLAEFDGRLRGDDRAFKPVANQEWQIAAVVEMGVGEQHGVDGLRIDRKAAPSCARAVCLNPWNSPQSTRMRPPSPSRRYLDPVTVPA